MITTKLPVRFVDCDAMGHVNNAVYYTYFEEGKREIFRWFTPNMDLNDWRVIVASTHCDYIQEINYDEEITIYTWISTISRSSFDVEHAIAGPSGNWHARGRVTLIGYDYRTKQVVPLTEAIKGILRQHQDVPEGVPALRPIRMSEGIEE
ncbi:acyl-CoA thioesterase [Sporolactobacillus shoreicorticis]|uniref:Acyl-CoA thioesterase n=1 Tax=Sporolactobacillus shoreicorticis TaxID=1923877 RepID=A0ABW5RZ76_9BACL|nr:acyl-CoA thioesterase [Sporolactobacillus shoreicorticis]MCO7125220.1 acyl-CoA thioesterase [Sporolactobacillus shoreicorticis]